MAAYTSIYIVKPPPPVWKYLHVENVFKIHMKFIYIMGGGVKKKKFYFPTVLFLKVAPVFLHFVII